MPRAVQTSSSSRYAVILHSDHGQTTVSRAAQLEVPLASHADSIVVTASNRAGQVYLLPDARVDAATLAARARCRAVRRDDAATRRRRGGRARDGEELRFRPAVDGWQTTGDASILGYPDALHRSWSALANPNAGELLVSAAEDWEFVDIGGRAHSGGGSHGSLVEGDSIVPVLTVGVDAPIERITDVTPAVLAHFTRSRVG